MVQISTADRLIFTVLFSIIIHMVIVLGMSFDVSSPPTNNQLVNLDITLVKEQTQQAPEQADFFAQANNEGGGLTDEAMPDPTSAVNEAASNDAQPSDSELPMETPVPAPITQIVPPQTEEPPTPEPITPEIIKLPPEVVPEPVKPKEKPPQDIEKVTQQQAERQVKQVPESDDSVEINNKQAVAAKPKLSAQELMLQARNEINNLQTRLNASTEALSKKPKKRRISSATKEFAAAAYMKSWEMKVERIGTMNYPQEAKRQGINGHLMLTVDIQSDGSVGPDGIVISRSSGYEILDQAAVRIVRLGAPYAPIPDDVLQDYDVLTIIRTWRFETDRGLSTH